MSRRSFIDDMVSFSQKLPKSWFKTPCCQYLMLWKGSTTRWLAIASDSRNFTPPRSCPVMLTIIYNNLFKSDSACFTLKGEKGGYFVKWNCFFDFNVCVWWKFVCVLPVFGDLLERINNMRVKHKPEMAECVFVRFLPYVFVPAGRSCFWLPNLIGLIVHPVTQKMQVGRHHPALWIGQFDNFFFFFSLLEQF